MTVAVSGDSITFPDNSVQATAPKVGMVNRIINGACVIDQRNAGASVTLTNQGYGLDRWTTWFSQTSKYTVQQNQGSVTPPTGFANYQGVTSSSAYTVAVGDYFGIGEKIEGYNIADFGWGTAGAQTITISFWVRSSLTGNFGAVLRSGDGGRYFAFTYPISAANTWEYKTVTIAGDTGGTWSTTNTTGIFLLFGLGTGANQTASANNTWIAGGVLGALGAVSVVGTSGATFYITGVQLEKGSTATSFDYRPYGTELGLCQRYYEVIDDFQQQEANAYAGYRYLSSTQFKVRKRATPTSTVILTYAWPNGGAVSNLGVGDTNECFAAAIDFNALNTLYNFTFRASAEL